MDFKKPMTEVELRLAILKSNKPLNFIQKFCGWVSGTKNSSHRMWCDISRNQKLSEEFMREFKEKINWCIISYNQSLSEDFIREFKDEVNWDEISIHQKLSDEFVEEFKEKLNLNELCINTVHNCGKNNRTILIKKNDPSTIHIGCFEGTKEEAIQAVQKK